MKDEFRATFSVDLAPEEVWQAVARSSPDGPATEPDGAAGPLQVWLPGFEAMADVLESVPGSLLRARKAEQPCKGTEIVVTLEAAGTGTRVTVVQSGFGAFFDIAVNWLGVGWDLIVRDLVVFIERGLRVRRYPNAWGPSIGVSLQETAAGLVVQPGQHEGAAAEAGLQPGDLLLTFAQSPVATTRDLSMVARTLPSGSVAAFTWARGREAMRGEGRL